MKYLITIRHGESFKNIKSIDGGKGESLTETGRGQIENSSKIIEKILEKLSDKNPKLKLKLYKSCSRVQLNETAQILQENLCCPPVEQDPRFAPIRLGVFNGMSSARQKELYPTSAKEMQEWCDGERDIMDVHVEGMQDPRDHVDRIQDFLSGVEDDTVVVLIGTRSDISAIKNITQRNHPAIKDSYRFFPTEFGEVVLTPYDTNAEGKLIFGNSKNISIEGGSSKDE